jgi:hypothetical protein
MKQSRFTDEQIIDFLKQDDAGIQAIAYVQNFRLRLMPQLVDDLKLPMIT